MNFLENYSIDYKKTNIVEKKGRFDFISWAHCQKLMKEIDNNATFTLKWNEQLNSYNWNGFVLIEMTINDKTVNHAYPILDNQNKPIESPTQFDINNAQMRGFAKLFSMETGHGLSLFTGEDLAQYENKVSENDLINMSMLLQKLPPEKRLDVTEWLATKKGIDVTNENLTKKEIAFVVGVINKTMKKLEEEVVK